MKPRVQPYGTKNISGANIERLRKSRGSSLSKLEGQVRIASDRELYAIAQIFSVPMEELVHPKDEPSE